MMKKGCLVAAATLMLLNLGLWGCKEESKSSINAVSSGAPGTQPAALGSVDQKVCPISDFDIDPAVFVEHEGKKVYFCCPGCIETFQKEPAKYLSKLPQFGGKESPSKGKMPA
jgi:YHS domain-containing protein